MNVAATVETDAPLSLCRMISRARQLKISHCEYLCPLRVTSPRIVMLNDVKRLAAKHLRGSSPEILQLAALASE